MTEMTVLEFCTHHVATQGCPESVKHHVDLLITGALNKNRTLWNVVHDDEGRPSLVWLSMDVRVWDALLESVLKAAAQAELEARVSAEVDAFLKRTFPS